MPDPGSASHHRDAMADKKPEPGAETGHNFRRIFRLRLKDIAGLMREAAIDWNDDNAPRLSLNGLSSCSSPPRTHLQGVHI